jgi:hypothetical protein
MFNLVRPCGNCPFLLSPYFELRPGRRAEIADSLRSGKVFPCHKTLGENEQFCAGALIAMAKADTLFQNQMVRIGDRLGDFDPDKLQMGANVYESLEDFEEDQRER